MSPLGSQSPPAPQLAGGRYACRIATVALWVASFLQTVAFLSLVTAIGPSVTFWLYAALSAFTFVFIWRVAPETRRKWLEVIERIWRTTR